MEKKIEYIAISEWVNEQYNIGIEEIEVIENLIIENKQKLENLKIEAASQEIEYLAKEKQISTFLECKKTFLGKFNITLNMVKRKIKQKQIKKYKKKKKKIMKKNLQKKGQ